MDLNIICSGWMLLVFGKGVLVVCECSSSDLDVDFMRHILTEVISPKFNKYRWILVWLALQNSLGIPDALDRALPT